ncbi:hypothetical protein, partial [Paenibacillus sp. EPM92]|uniref:hypothetical protein n=1 Tax=Paenibacillus sp. EPM92 TaxID=1561195 RepID=UPI001F20B79B
MRAKPHVNENVQLHMSASYIRNGRSRSISEPNKPKRIFSLVIKGFMLSSVLLSSFATAGIPAFAATSPALPTHPITTQAPQQVQEDVL